MREYKLQYVTNVIVTDNMYNINNGSRSKQVLLTTNQTIQTDSRRLYFISRSNFVAVNLCLSTFVVIQNCATIWRFYNSKPTQNRTQIGNTTKFL
jgi:hypothetical protein